MLLLLNQLALVLLFVALLRRVSSCCIVINLFLIFIFFGRYLSRLCFEISLRVVLPPVPLVPDSLLGVVSLSSPVVLISILLVVSFLSLRLLIAPALLAAWLQSVILLALPSPLVNFIEVGVLIFGPIIVVFRILIVAGLRIPPGRPVQVAVVPLLVVVLLLPLVLHGLSVLDGWRLLALVGVNFQRRGHRFLRLNFVGIIIIIKRKWLI